jgi:hypothetical protein
MQLALALDVLKAEEHPWQLQRSLAYTVARTLPAHDLARWREVARAVLRDLSAADHPDHAVLALHTLACLPDECLLDLVVDGATDARLEAVLEHVSPAVRGAAVVCVAGAWLRAWTILVGGGLRGRVLPRDEDGSVVAEGDVRQLACDRVVAVWKKILERCTKDEDDSVVAAAFEAMRDLFASCWARGGVPRSFAAFHANARRVRLVTRSLLLRVFKSIGVRVYSLMARLRSLAPGGTALPRALPGMAAFFRYAMASGQTMRLEGTSRDFSPVGLAREFVDTILLPLVDGASTCEALMSAAYAVLELCDATGAAHAIEVDDRQRWCGALARAVLAHVGGGYGGGAGGGVSGGTVLLSGAEDSVALLLYRCMGMLPLAAMRVECAVAIVRAVSAMAGPGRGAVREAGTCGLDSSLGHNSTAGDRLRWHLVRGVARAVLQTSMSTNAGQGPFLLERFFRGGEWMRSLWDGRIWLPAFREELASIFLEEAQAMAPDCLRELDKQNAVDGRRTSRGLLNPASGNQSGAHANTQNPVSDVILDLSLGDMFDTEDGAHPRASSDCPEACLPWLAVVHTLLHVCAPTLNWPGLLPGSPTRAACAYIDVCTSLCNRIGVSRDARLRQMLDDLFEWHLPSITSPRIRLHVVRMLCAFWVCDAHDLGDAETLVACMRDLLFGDALFLAVQAGSHEFSPYPLPTKHEILGGSGGGGGGGRRAAVGYGHSPLHTGEDNVYNTSGQFNNGGGSLQGGAPGTGQWGDTATTIGSSGHEAAFTVLEFANVLLPAAALFASRNPVAKDCVGALLDCFCETNRGPSDKPHQNSSSMRNPILISLARRMKKWLASDEAGTRAKKTVLGFSHLVGECMPRRKTLEELCRFRHMMGAPAPFCVLNGAMDPVACQVRHFIVGERCRVDVRVVNLTRSDIANLVFDLGLSGPVAPLDGAPASRRLFEGELLPGDVLEWSTTFSILAFGEIVFHPRLTIPGYVNAGGRALCSADDDWEMPGGDAEDNGAESKEEAIGEVSQLEQRRQSQQSQSQQPALYINCAPYVLGIAAVMCPTPIDATTFATYWTASKYAHVVRGVWESERNNVGRVDAAADTNPDIFKDPFSLQFASVISSRCAVVGGILSAAFFATTVTREIVCLNIAAFEIAGASPLGCARWSAKFEFRSDKRSVVDALKRVSEGSGWFRRLSRHGDTQVGTAPVVSQLHFETEEGTKSALSRWQQMRARA